MKKNVAILMGGFSKEFDISLKSGNVIFENIDKSKFSPYKVIIKKDLWYYLSLEGLKFKINKDDFSVDLGNKLIHFEIALIMIHGSPGEDGILQSYFELLNIPYTGCSPYTSALTFNKRDCISILKKFDIPTAKSVYLNKSEFLNEDEVVEKVGLPCFVKANKYGSSYGVFKVNFKNELSASIKSAFEYDDEILIESFLDGKEVSVGVMKYNDVIKVFGITELISDNDFFDYNAKYNGQSQEITPAKISEVQRKNVSEMAIKIYRKLGIKGLSRSEFIFVDETPFFLELNSIPGMTKESIFPKQAKKSGISLQNLISELIKQAIE